jgi:hypothetical protein
MAVCRQNSVNGGNEGVKDSQQKNSLAIGRIGEVFFDTSRGSLGIVPCVAHFIVR